MNAVSINTQINTITTTQGYFNTKLNQTLITNTLISIIFYLYTACKSFYFTATINGVLYEHILDCPEDTKFNLTLNPGDVVVITVHHDDNPGYSKTITFTVDAQGDVSSEAPKGVKLSTQTKSTQRKEIHSKYRQAA